MASKKAIQHHQVFVMERGGKRRIGQLRNLDLVRWNRVRDDISEATIHLSGDLSSSQERLLNSMEPGRHEICIYRDGVRSWEGPMLLPTYARDGVTIGAKDVMYYLYRTVMHAGYDSSYPHIEYTTARLKRIMIAELARKEGLTPPYNIVPFITEHHTADDAKTSAVTTPYQYSVFEHIDSMAENNGIDYTVLGRAIHLWDTSVSSMGQTRTVTENDFLGDVYVSVYGSELATASVVTGQDGAFSYQGGIDSFYGEWEVIASPYDESDGATPPTQAEMDSQAQRNLSGRLPTPLQVRVPDNSSINPNGVLSIADLVPGVYIPLLAKLNIREVSQMQKLNTMQVEETAKGETITVAMTPAPQIAPEEDD